MVDEEETNEEPEDTATTEDTGDKPTTTPLIDIANASAKRMEEANKVTAELLARQEALEQRRALGGGSEAGGEPVKPKEETPKEYKERIDKEIKEGQHDD